MGDRSGTVRRRSIRWLVVGAILLLLFGVFAWPKLARMMDVDYCYDSGGVYLSELNKCTHSQAEVDAYLPRKTGS
jgi:hypothetical protein